MSDISNAAGDDTNAQGTPPPYMLAGSPDNPEISLATGQVSLTRELLTMQAGPDINYRIQISYNSSTANQVKTWNLDAPSGVTGFGWNFGRDQIITMMDSSTMLPRYVMTLQGSMANLKRNGVEGEEQCFVTEPYEFWKIRYIPALNPWDEKWVVTLDNGLIYHFGKTMDSVELGIRRANYYGDGMRTPQEQIGVVWNLAKIEDQWGNKLEFNYEQVQPKLGTAGKEFTRSCHLTKIISTDGRYIELSYAQKQSTEYEKPHVPLTGEDPGEGIEAYEDRYEAKYLDTVSLHNSQNQVMEKVNLQYQVGFLGDSHAKTTKRTLLKLERLTARGDQIEPPETFYYYHRLDQSPGALYGALKCIITPDEAIVYYQYQSEEATHCPLDIKIHRPDIDYDIPSAFYGPNYVVVGWTKKNSKNSYVCKLTVYTWLGYWAAQTVGEVPYSEEFSVLPGSNFFTIVSDDVDHTLSLVAQDIRKPAEWTLTTYTSETVPADRLVSNGLDFVAIVKPDEPAEEQLMVFSRKDGTCSWQDESFDIPPLLNDNIDSQYCLSAQGETIFTAMCPLPNRNQSEYLKYKIFVRNKAGGWIDPEIATGPEIKITSNHWTSKILPDKRSAITVFGSSFVALQVSFQDNDHHAWEWQHYAFVWTKTMDETTWMNVKTVTDHHSGFFGDNASCHMRAIGHAIHIDLKRENGSGRKYLYRYVGSGPRGGSPFIEQEFHSSGADNQFFYGPDSCTIDHDKKSKLWSLDLYDNQWKQREVTPFKDDAPSKNMSDWNVFLNIWESASYMLIAIPIPLVGELSLLTLDLALLGIDQYLSIRSAGPEGFHAGSNYFSAHHSVWHLETNGSYIEIGSLLKDGEKLESQYTQAASDYIAYSVKNEGTFVQMLKNGKFWGDRILVEEKEGRGSMKERFWLQGVGPHCLLTWASTRDSEDTPRTMTLSRIAGGRMKGNQTCYCVSKVTVDDGFRQLHTDYQYDGTTASPRGVNGMQFGTVTTLYSGASDSPSDASGKRDSHFYAWKDAGYHSWILNGTQYAEEVYEQGISSPVQKWTQTYETYEPLQGHPDVFYIRAATREETVDGCVQTTTLTYSTANGRVASSLTARTNVAGNESTFLTLYTYAFTRYDSLKQKNILDARCQVRQAVTNHPGPTTTTGITVTTWGPNPSRSDVVVPLESYQALAPMAEFDYSTNSPTVATVWNPTEQAQAWDATTGAVVEVGTFPASGVTVTSSNILDTTGELTLASITNAGAVENECGYYGFGGNDQSDGWDLSSPTRIGRQSEQFQPREGATAYVVSAYFLFQPDQAPGTYPELGFGSLSKQVVPGLQWQWNGGTARWQYAEYITTAPAAGDLPFATYPAGVDTIRGFRFGPVDAPFTAARYDALLRVPLTTMNSNGYSETVLLDYRRRPSAVITGDGGVNALTWSADATRGPGTSNFVPSQSMTLTARSGGPYLEMTQRGEQSFNTTETNAAVQVAIPDRESVDIDFTITFADCSVQCTFGEKDGKGTVTLNNIAGKSRITGNSPVTQSISTKPKKLAVWFAPQHLWVWINDMPCVDVGLSLPGTGSGQLVVSDQNLPAGRDKNASTGRLRDLCVAFDPIAGATYGNGLGQTVQTQTPGDDGASIVYHQLFWNGWGTQEIQTKPMSAPAPGPWSYLSTCASFDETNGQLSGKVVTYYQENDPTDAPYAYSRVRSEANPMGRPIISSMPGKDFQTTSKGQVTLTYGTGDQYASALLTRLGLSNKASSFNATTSLRYIGSQPVPEVTLTDQSGETVATSLGADSVKQQVETAVTIFPKGSPSTVLTPPGGSDYAVTTNDTFWGTLSDSTDTDTGTTQSMATYAGRIRFVQQDGASVIIVHKYDGLGRVIEQGELTDTWDNLTQTNAQDPNYPLPGNPPEPSDKYQVRVRMNYDIDPTNLSPNLHGRLWKVVTNVSGAGSDETTQTFTYDAQGRILTTDLTVNGFDATARRTTYAYDWMGNVQSITYPEGEFILNYSYNLNGRLAEITNANTGVRYAYYTYTLDGAIDIVQPINSSWYRQYGYTFQGALNSIQVMSKWNWSIWYETLDYEANGEYLGGNIYKVTLGGGVSEGFTFGYDSQGRLQKTTYAGRDPGGDLQITYDLRNNLSDVYDNGAQSEQRTAIFESGSNKLTSVFLNEESMFNPNPDNTFDYAYTPDGKVTQNSQISATRYDSVLQQIISTKSKNYQFTGTISFQYDGQGARRVLKVATPSQGQAQTTLYLRGNQALPLRELDRTGGTETTPIDYIYGVEGLIASKQGDTLTYVLMDHLGTTRATMDGNDPESKLNGQAYYDIFGVFDYDDKYTGACKQFRYLFTGQEYDGELGMYNYRRRMYDPSASAFLTEDPMKQDYSPYAYVGGNPANYTDPTGMMLKSVAKAVGAASDVSKNPAAFEKWLKEHNRYIEFAKLEALQADARCFEAAQEMSALLARNKVSHKIRAIKIWKHPKDQVTSNHFVIQARVADDHIVIDPTRQQFNGLDAFLGPLETWHNQFFRMHRYGRMKTFEVNLKAAPQQRQGVSSRAKNWTDADGQTYLNTYGFPLNRADS